MSATCRRHVADKAKCCLFLSRQANLGHMIFSVSAHICVSISRHLLTKDRQYLVERATNSYVDGDLHNCSPQNKKPQKIQKIICRLHPLASRLHLLVCSSVCLFLWLVVASSLCPLLLRPVPSRRRATLFRYRLSSSLVLIKSLRRRVVASLHRCIVASRLAS